MKPIHPNPGFYSQWRRCKLQLLWLLILCGGCFSGANARDRTLAKTRYDIGVATLGQGDLRGALKELLAAVELNPNQSDAHHVLGLVFYRMGRHEDARKHYEKALKLNPEFSEAHNNFGVLLLELGAYEESIGHFQAALDDILYATPALAEGNMGWAYYQNDDVERAVRHLRNATATSPKFCRGYEWLSRIGLARDDAAQVIANGARFQKYCIDNENIAATIPKDYKNRMQYYLALGHLKRGEHGRARDILSMCASHTPQAGFAAKCAASLGTLDNTH